jgi:hypothetical protein
MPYAMQRGSLLARCGGSSTDGNDEHLRDPHHMSARETQLQREKNWPDTIKTSDTRSQESKSRLKSN